MLTSARGDTLIEVLFAVAVFSLVVVGAIGIMNQGTSASQRAVDTSLVRQEIDGQAEALRFIRDSYVAAYRPGITFAATDTSPAAQWSRIPETTDLVPFEQVTECPAPTAGSFVVDAQQGQVRTANITAVDTNSTYARVVYDTARGGAYAGAQGIWVQAVRGNDTAGGAGFIDFHIRACWETAGQRLPSTQGTIVRLYEPRA